MLQRLQSSAGVGGLNIACTISVELKLSDSWRVPEERHNGGTHLLRVVRRPFQGWATGNLRFPILHLLLDHANPELLLSLLQSFAGSLRQLFVKAVDQAGRSQQPKFSGKAKDA